MRCLFLLLAFAANWRVAETGPRKLILDGSALPGVDGESINGPSLIRVPAWVKNPLGRYYLYFAHHQGKYIRLAFSDSLDGPWKIHAGGVLRLDAQKTLSGHIASPEAVIDEDRKRVVLFYHGQVRSEQGDREGQASASAVSANGLHFEPRNQIQAPAYFRIFRHNGVYYGVAGQTDLYRAANLDARFEKIGRILSEEALAGLYPKDLKADRKATRGRERVAIRHDGVDVYNGMLTIYFTCVGHNPERILATRAPMTGAPGSWRSSEVVEVLRAREKWEGGDVAAKHSFGGVSRETENALRDPAVFREGAKAWLLYAAAGEHGLGIVPIRY